MLQQKYKGVGSTLVAVAMQLSIEEGFQGRIGLHSLPQSDDWYSQKMQMIDLRKDIDKQKLKYFEITSEKANEILEI